ncbi:MAG: DMT family transporter [bacterium]
MLSSPLVSDPAAPPADAAPLTTGWTVFMVVQMALWGLSYPIIAMATADGGFTSPELTALRTIGAAMLLSPVAGRAAFAGTLPPSRDIAKIIGWGAWYFAGALSCFNGSIAMGRPELSGILFSAFPIILALLAATLHIERLDQRAWPYIALSLLGATVVATNGDFAKLAVITNDLRATGLMSLSMVMVAGYVLGAKHLLRLYDPWLFTSLALLGGSVAFLLWSLVSGHPVIAPGPRDLSALFAAVYLCLVNSLFTEWMSMASLKRLSVVLIGVFNYLQPLFAVLFTLCFPGEHTKIGWPLVIGGLAILCGASTVGTMRADADPWPVALWARLTTGSARGGTTG